MQKLDSGPQDRLAFHLLKRRGYEIFMAGKMSRTEFGKQLAMEWTSFPVLVGTHGAHQKGKCGQLYLSAMHCDKSLIKPEAIEAALVRMKATASVKPAAPAEAPSPATVKTDSVTAEIV